MNSLVKCNSWAFFPCTLVEVLLRFTSTGESLWPKATAHTPRHPQNPHHKPSLFFCPEASLTCRKSDLRAGIARSRNLFVLSHSRISVFLLFYAGPCFFFIIFLLHALCIFVLSSLYYLLRPHFSSFCTFLLYYRPFSLAQFSLLWPDQLKKVAPANNRSRQTDKLRSIWPKWACILYLEPFLWAGQFLISNIYNNIM